VLIDCDLRRPKLHRAFGKSSDIGVSTALIDGEFDEVVLETRVPNLSLIPCGPVPPNPAELFHSSKFKALLQTMGERFDRVVIDSPPIAAVTDPTILSTLVDGTVLVARAFSTRKEIARHAVRSLHSVGGKVAGAVLNAVDFSKLEYRYSYHYYYYRKDGYYYSEDAPLSTTGDRSGAEPSRDQHAASAN
jgi:capsular exopolysaccharide synthesis family protein